MINKLPVTAYKKLLQSLEASAIKQNYEILFASVYDKIVTGMSNTGYDMSYRCIISVPDVMRRSIFYKVPMEQVVETIINVQHEFRHLDQRRGLQTSNRFDFMTVPFIVKYNNSGYYSANGRYYTDLSELDAEYNGIIAGYQYISEHFGEDTADHYVFEYIKTRCKNDYFIDDDFETIDEALDKFDEKIKAVMKQRPSSDYFPRFHRTDTIVKIAYDNPQIMDKLMSLNSDERDRFVAAVNLYQNTYMKDAYYQTDLPSLQDFGININDLVLTKNDTLPYGVRNSGDGFDESILAADNQQYESQGISL